MEPRRFRRQPRVELLGREAVVATGLWARLLGLALLPRSRARAGLLIPRCRSVHTFGMRFPVDICFLDRRGLVLRAEQAVPPGRILACAGASAVLELPATRSGPRLAGVGSPYPEKEKNQS